MHRLSSLKTKLNLDRVLPQTQRALSGGQGQLHENPRKKLLLRPNRTFIPYSVLRRQDKAFTDSVQNLAANEALQKINIALAYHAKRSSRFDIAYLNTTIALYMDANQDLFETLEPSRPYHQQTVNILYNYAKIAKQIYDTKPLQTQALRAIPHYHLDRLFNLELTGARDPATLIYALGLLSSLDLIDTLSVQEELDAFVHQSLLNNPNAIDISMMLYGLGLLAHTNDLDLSLSEEDINFFVSRLLSMNANSQSFSNSMYGLGLLSQKGVVDLSDANQSKLFNHCLDMDSESRTHSEQIAMACAYLGLDMPNHCICILKKAKPTPQFIQKALEKALMELKNIKSVYSEKFLSAFYVDLFVETIDGRRFVIEVDGAHHYALGELRFQDVARDKYLEAEYELKVLRYPTQGKSYLELKDEIVSDMKRRVRPLAPSTFRIDSLSYKDMLLSSRLPENHKSSAEPATEKQRLEL